MSKIPMETRPIRISAEITQALEDMLRPYMGKKLEAAQSAVLKVYHSGAQRLHGEWLTAYSDAIKAAVKEQKAAA